MDEVTKNKHEKPFIGFIRYQHRFGHDAFLVNPTNRHYSRVISLSADQVSDEEGVYESGKSLKERGELEPQSAFMLESYSDIGAADYLTWYHLDLYEKGKDEPERYIFAIPKPYDYKDELLPILNRDGMIVALGTEHREKTILEDVKTRDMISGYWKDGKKLYS